MRAARLNTRWIKQRAAFWRCRHRWMAGDTAGAKACRRCGVWRWFPVLTPPSLLPSGANQQGRGSDRRAD